MLRRFHCQAISCIRSTIKSERLHQRLGLRWQVNLFFWLSSTMRRLLPSVHPSVRMLFFFLPPPSVISLPVSDQCSPLPPIPEECRWLVDLAFLLAFLGGWGDISKSVLINTDLNYRGWGTVIGSLLIIGLSVTLSDHTHAQLTLRFFFF